MTTWILTMILIVDNSRVATSIATQEFSSKEKCEIAKSNFISLNEGSAKYRAYCIEK